MPPPVKAGYVIFVQAQITYPAFTAVFSNPLKHIQLPHLPHFAPNDG